MAEQRVAEEQYYEDFDPAKLIAKIKADAAQKDIDAVTATDEDKE
ncbi:MAG: hypothetical protein Q3976_04325 [Corynebacterium sp.]|nr:hypothetical protein [Corynebacterium sp.]